MLLETDEIIAAVLMHPAGLWQWLADCRLRLQNAAEPWPSFQLATETGLARLVPVARESVANLLLLATTGPATNK